MYSPLNLAADAVAAAAAAAAWSRGSWPWCCQAPAGGGADWASVVGAAAGRC